MLTAMEVLDALERQSELNLNASRKDMLASTDPSERMFLRGRITEALSMQMVISDMKVQILNRKVS